MSDTREEAIRVRAHRLWEEGGHQYGHHDEHWAQAERDIDLAEGDEQPDAHPSSELSTAIAASGEASRSRRAFAKA